MKSYPGLFILFLFIVSCHESSQKPGYYVAAYVWPSCHNDESALEKLWPDGIGEWEIIKKGTPRFEGHYQPRVPLWGYLMDDDPQAWEKKIAAAEEHGVNVFIFDWYWFDGKPFLENALNSGFLKAKNSERLKFYLMWANHDVPGNMWNPYLYNTDSLIWHGMIDWDNYKIIVDRIINQYFRQPNYFKIDDKPVFSIYSLTNFIKSFEGIAEAKNALDYFRDKTIEAGFPGLHIQLIGFDRDGNPDFGEQVYSIGEVVDRLGINSVTMYNMSGISNRSGDYLRYGVSAIHLRNKWDSLLNVPFFPCVSVGWDNTPRYLDMGKDEIVYFNNTPGSFGAFFQKAKEYADNHPDQPRLIIVNAWNEWVEGSYLEPDMLWGYGYLEAIKKVLEGKYETRN